MLRLFPDYKKALNEFEAEWDHSDRSKDLVEEKKKRNDMPHGYLSVCLQSMVFIYYKITILYYVIKS